MVTPEVTLEALMDPKVYIEIFKYWNRRLTFVFTNEEQSSVLVCVCSIVVKFLAPRTFISMSCF